MAVGFYTNTKLFQTVVWLLSESNITPEVLELPFEDHYQVLELIIAT
jgi:hypothetical protein